MAIHLRTDPGAYAPAVLCPGDPRRATYIAQTMFDPGARLVNDERGLLGYTGTFAGKPISVQTTGMGCPSAGIVCEELVMLGATRLIRVGTAGGLRAGTPDAGIQMGDVVVAVSASADDPNPLRYAAMPGFAPTASWELVERAVQFGRADGLRVHAGPIVTSGVFYDPDPTSFGRWAALGHIAVEMEAAMIYAIAAVKGIEALAIMTVSDVLGGDGSSVRISDEELKVGVDRMMQVACQVAIS